MTIAPWFQAAGLGRFVHWDHTSQQGIKISWPLVDKSIIPGRPHAEGQVTAERYHSTAATFNPTRWDASELARLAWAAGARYLIFTAHHISFPGPTNALVDVITIDLRDPTR
jgi:alpha-L-fucosidase